MNPSSAEKNPPFAWWEATLVATAATLALVLGFSCLGGPSLWHDEAVQVLVAKRIAETGHAALPSGKPHPVAPVFNAILAACIALFGDAEAVVRAPSVVFAAINVCLTYFFARPLLGRAPALLAAFALALSPWSVAWSRQARFYAFQQTTYLLFLGAAWGMVSRTQKRQAALCAIGAAAAYLLGIGASLHSVLFLVPPGLFALCMLVIEKQRRWLLLGILVGIAGAATLIIFRWTLPEHDAGVVFRATQPAALGGDPARSSPLYYLAWLYDNLGRGFLLLALWGSALMIVREARRGLFAAFAFWGPIAILSIILAYRQHRFMYFAFPAYTMAFSYAIVLLAGYAIRARRSWTSIAITVVIIVFGVRLSVSAVRQVRDSTTVARGADTTLATRHPQYRKPCLYVRAHCDPQTVVIADTYVTALYYVGRVDNWYPSKYLPWEAWEIGSEGLRTLNDLKAYIAEHPKGYFIAEWYRFQFFDVLAEDRAWVNAHMTRVEDACSGDVSLYAWGMDVGADLRTRLKSPASTSHSSLRSN